MNPNSMTNERLCTLAQKGDEAAREILVEKNMGFIVQTADLIYRSSSLEGSDLNIDVDDLVQEGSIGLLRAVDGFDPARKLKFLTYAAPFIRNAMTDLVREAFSRYEQRMVDSENGLGLQKVRLDEVLPGEERLLRTAPPNLRNRFMRKEKPCGSCMRAWDKSPSGSRRIFCTDMALRTILGTR